MNTEQDYDVGVIVGRFQVPELHGAHLDLIQSVCDQHDKVVIVLGLSEVKVTRNNPLDFEARKQMILHAFDHVNVVYVNDHPSDQAWSKHLDKVVESLITPGQRPVLYGGRDSFISHYSGKFPTKELIQDVFVSGTQIRKDVSRKSVRGTADFRAGATWATANQYPTVHPTVDVAIFNEDETQILLGQKESDGDKWRFIGGFSDPNNEGGFEADARREVQEETGLAITDPEYVGSFKQDDWRYRNEANKIKTIFFKAKVMFGRPEPADDIDRLKWFTLDNVYTTHVVKSHLPLLWALKKNMGLQVPDDK